MSPERRPNAIRFIRSQKLYLLAGTADPRAAVHPEQFHADRTSDGEKGPKTPDAKLWRELPRPALVGGAFDGQVLHRVAVTTDAGGGKSYNLRQFAHELNAPGGSSLAFLLKVGDLKSAPDLIAGHLAPAVRTGKNADADAARIAGDLMRMRDRGQVVLLFDGLDQADDTSVAELAALLHPDAGWGRCRVIVAGRPFALERHWGTLFAGRSWRFVQVAEFDERQQRQAIGTARFDAIPREARPILTIPRVLETITELTPAELTALTTVADVYWVATERMLRKATAGPTGRLAWQRYLALLGALAFTMYARTETDPKTGRHRPNLDRIRVPDLPGFLLEVQGRMLPAFPGYTSGQFEADLKELGRFNRVVFNHGWLDVDEVCADSELLWRNASLQEFFAAYWATRWGRPEDHTLLRGWAVEEGNDTNRGFYWFWRYATEMHADAVHIDSRQPPTVWQAAIGVLYDGRTRDEQGRPIRSPEFLYRSWARMTATDAPAWRQFVGQFVAIRRGECGEKAKQIADRMIDGEVVKGKRQTAFIPLVGNPELKGDTGEFAMGATKGEGGGSDERPRHRVRLTKPFLLHRYCVTNAEYELYDPRHAVWRWTEKPHPLVAKGGVSADDGCPVVNVSWYGAWCFAVWSGCRLPTEAEWEYGCRAGRETPYSVGDGETLTAAVCHFGQPFGSGHTLPVGGLPGGVNGWGFAQMHGNVWEWCGDWYRDSLYTITSRVDPVGPESGSGRVGRGGGCYNSAGRCRSAYRNGHWPEDRLRILGFRLAAVPPSGRPGG